MLANQREAYYSSAGSEAVGVTKSPANQKFAINSQTEGKQPVEFDIKRAGPKPQDLTSQA